MKKVPECGLLQPKTYAESVVDPEQLCNMTLIWNLNKSHGSQVSQFLLYPQANWKDLNWDQGEGRNEPG